MKKFISLVLVVTVALSMILTGCKSAETSTTIKLGLLVPKTGKIAQYGIAVENAVKLAVKEANDAGGINGKQVELFSYDNEADATKSVSLFNRLVDNDKIDALIGPVISSTSLAVAPVANELKIPMISPTATNKDVTVGYDYVFRACYIDPYQGAVVGKFASENLKATKAAVLVNTASDYSVGLAEAFKASFEAKGGTITNYESYTDADKDFKSILTTIKAGNPEVIFIPDYYNAVGNIASQIKEVGITASLLGGDGWDDIQKEYADVVEGGYFANHYATSDNDPVVVNFINAYKAAYNETPNALGALGYDATKVMLAAFAKAESNDSEKVLEALKATDIDAVCGHIVFDENGDPKKAISMIKVTGGELQLEAKISE